MLSANYSAEFGGSAGAVVSFATKSGTNNWHGTLYEYLRNDKVDAESYFDTGQVPLSSQPVWRHHRRPDRKGQDVPLCQLRRTPTGLYHDLGRQRSQPLRPQWRRGWTAASVARR